MAEFLELIEAINAESATVQKLFGEDGNGVHALRETRGKTPLYMQRLLSATQLVSDVVNGRKPAYLLREAMTTSDFPLLFGDIIDRQVLASYREWPVTWPNYIKRAQVTDFRQVKRFTTYGADDVLPTVAEGAGYPMAKIEENSPYVYRVQKRGRRIPFSWEVMINDDLQALTDVTERLGRGARRSEERFSTELFVDGSGPHAAVYTVGNGNIITGNPALSIPALQTGMIVLGNMVDENGEPIVIETVELVVPPALEITAQNILNALQLEIGIVGQGAVAAPVSEQRLVTTNWMKNRMHLSLNPYIPRVASVANGNTSWFLFANPNNGRPAAELGFLRGHTEPEIFIKEPNARRVGGGINPLDGDFDTDSIEYKVRHVFGGAIMDPKMTVASNGSGA